jgi:hypothetical protein
MYPPGAHGHCWGCSRPLPMPLKSGEGITTLKSAAQKEEKENIYIYIYHKNLRIPTRMQNKIIPVLSKKKKVLYIDQK